MKATQVVFCWINGRHLCQHSLRFRIGVDLMRQGAGSCIVFFILSGELTKGFVKVATF
jgi:hypothetical protein